MIEIVLPRKVDEEGWANLRAHGSIWVLADIECQNCAKVQSVAQTGGLGADCIRCGYPTLPYGPWRHVDKEG